MQGINPEAFGVQADSIDSSYKKKVLDSSSLSFEITDSIHNENGLLLLKAGSQVDKTAYENIVKHKLMKPLDECIKLRDQYTAEKLLVKFEALMKGAFADQVTDFDETMEVIDKIISDTRFDDFTLNKLTVFDSQSHEAFDHSIATAFLGTLVGKRLDYPYRKLADIFCACLFHDIGEMFLDIDIHDTVSDLTEEQFNRIKAHPIVAYSMLKESKTDFSQDMLLGILDHHERLDGSGYPRGLPEENINGIARILSTIDTFDAMLRKGRSVEDALWGIKLYGGNRLKNRYLDENICNVLYSLKDSLGSNDRAGQNAGAASYEDLAEHVNQLRLFCAEISGLKNQLQTCAAGNIDARRARLLDEISDNLFIIENRIFATSGLGAVTKEEILGDADYAVSLQADVNRITPELVHLFDKISRSINQVDSADQGGQFAGVATAGQSLQQRIKTLNFSTG